MSDNNKTKEAVTCAIRHIGTGIYSSGKIRLYLMQRGYSEAVAVEAVKLLIDSGYIDDLRASEIIDQGIRADTGIDLAHAAFDDHDLLFAELSLTEPHPGELFLARHLRGLFQALHLDVHRADDTDLLFFCFIGGIAFCAPG